MRKAAPVADEPVDLNADADRDGIAVEVPWPAEMRIRQMMASRSATDAVVTVLLEKKRRSVFVMPNEAVAQIVAVVASALIDQP